MKGILESPQQGATIWQISFVRTHNKDLRHCDLNTVLAAWAERLASLRPSPLTYARATQDGLFLQCWNHKRFDGQRQLERDRLGCLANGVATLLKAEFARQHNPARFDREFEK